MKSSNNKILFVNIIFRQQNVCLRIIKWGPNVSGKSRWNSCKSQDDIYSFWLVKSLSQLIAAFGYEKFCKLKFWRYFWVKHSQSMWQSKTVREKRYENFAKFIWYGSNYFIQQVKWIFFTQGWVGNVATLFIANAQFSLSFWKCTNYQWKFSFEIKCILRIQKFFSRWNRIAKCCKASSL